MVLLQVDRLYVLVNVIIVLLALEGAAACKELVGKNSYAPIVHFVVVLGSRLKQFWCQIVRGATESCPAFVNRVS